MDITVGSVVRSIKGRDTGNLYVVQKLDNEFCYLVDGLGKKLESPKKKKIKHVDNTGIILESIANKFNSNMKVFDSEVNSALRVVNKELAEEK